MKKIEYSKILAGGSLLLFIFTLICSFIFMFYVSMNSELTVYDVTIFVTALSITGGVYGATNKYYYQKSGLQNCIQIKKGFYEDAMKIRVEYDKQILELMEEHNVSKDEISEIENETNFVELSNSAMNEVLGKIDTVETDVSSEVDFSN